MSYNEERGFDEMLHKATPYLLFCYEDDQKKIVNILRSLFDSINGFTFQENYDALKKVLDEIKLDPERNSKLMMFHNQYHSLGVRFSDLNAKLDSAIDGFDVRLKKLECAFPKSGGLLKKMELIDRNQNVHKKSIKSLNTKIQHYEEATKKLSEEKNRNVFINKRGKKKVIE